MAGRFRLTPTHTILWGGLRSLLADYELSFRQPREHPFASDGPSNLERMAVMQAAYLSARTGSPEEPERILGTGK